MNRNIIPIGIDIDSVKSIFGSKDEVLFKQLLKSNFFKKFDEEFSFKNELYDIIFNYVPVQNRIIKPSKLFGLIKGDNGRGLEGDWNDYGYALLTICCFLGKKFSNDEAVFNYDESWWQINTLLRANKASFDLARMLESRQIFDTPYEKDELYINYYSKEEVLEFVTHILNIENEIKKENLPMYETLKNGLLNCKENNLDLVIFSHEI